MKKNMAIRVHHGVHGDMAHHAHKKREMHPKAHAMHDHDSMSHHQKDSHKEHLHMADHHDKMHQTHKEK
jgi:hypothetical protein